MRRDYLGLCRCGEVDEGAALGNGHGHASEFTHSPAQLWSYVSLMLLDSTDDLDIFHVGEL